MIGEKIKKLRVDNQLTQKELAEKLFVTSQAVSRWENNEVEPSINTIVEIAKIFNVPTDTLLDVHIEKEETITTEIVYKDAPKQHLALCEHCNSPIYNKENIKRITKDKVSHILCPSCHVKHLAEQKKARDLKVQELVNAGIKRRVLSFIFGGLAAAILIAIGIFCLVKGSSDSAIVYFVLSVMAFTAISNLILNNNFVDDMFFTICTWGVVKFPGVIWSLSFDGFMFLIAVKLLFWVLGIIFGLLACAFAVVVTAIVSPFVYPYSIIKNFRHPELVWE